MNLNICLRTKYLRHVNRLFVCFFQQPFPHKIKHKKKKRFEERNEQSEIKLINNNKKVETEEGGAYLLSVVRTHTHHTTRKHFCFNGISKRIASFSFVGQIQTCGIQIYRHDRLKE